MTLRPGTLLSGRFDIERLIAKGGMGAIYRAQDRSSGHWVALKVLLEREHSSSEAVERFSREANLLAMIRHPSVVGYVSHGHTDDGQSYLATEWLDGEDLAKRLMARGLTLAESLTCLHCATAGLQAAHEQGIIHRDIKPGNLFLRDCRVELTTVIDLGIARPEFLVQTLTATGIAIGTPSFMAPEQARGERAITPAADIYSLGCVLFQCLTGRPPFIAEQPLAILAKLLNEEAPSVRSVRPELPSALDDLLTRMLAKDPKKRPQRCRELLDEMERLNLAILESSTQSVVDAPLTVISGESQHVICVIVGAPPEQTQEVKTQLEDEDEDMPTMAIPTADIQAAPVNPMREKMDQIARLYGSQSRWLPDGSLVITMVGKSSALDLVDTAGRCALAVSKAWPGMQVAMATGRGYLTQEIPVGEAIDRAFKLLRSMVTTDQGLADVDPDTDPETPSSILVDDVSARLLEGRYELSTKDGTAILTGESGVDEGRRLLGKPTPCIGRDRELNLLGALFASCVEDSEARAVLMLGGEGMGKSRLKHEFLRQLQVQPRPPLILTANGDMQTPGVPYALVRQALRQLCQVQDSLPIHEQRERIALTLNRYIAKGDRQFVCEFVGELCGVAFPDEDSPKLHAARLDSRLMCDQITRAFIMFVTAACEQDAVVLSLDDLHWGDKPSVQLLDSTLRDLRNRPLLVLALGRPEAAGLFPNLWKGHKLQEMPLKALSKRACQQLVEHVLGKNVDPAIVARVTEQASGNALYLEELIRMVGEGRFDQAPDSVLVMVQLRINELRLRLRRVLLAASVFGSSFWSGGIEALVAPELGAGALKLELDELVQAEFIEQQHASRHAGHQEYSFRNPVLRDAAYALLTDIERRAVHRHAARWLEEAGESNPMTLALHKELGGEQEAAVRYYLQGAEFALARYALEAAITAAQRGRACGAVDAVLGELLAIEAIANAFMFRIDISESLGKRAMELLLPTSRHLLMFKPGLIILNIRRGQADAAREGTREFILRDPLPEDVGTYVLNLVRSSLSAAEFGYQDISSAIISRCKELQLQAVKLDINVAATIAHAHSDYCRAFDRDPWQTWLSANEAATGHQVAGDWSFYLSAVVRVGQAACELGNAELGIQRLREARAEALRTRFEYLSWQAQIHLAAALAALPNSDAWQEADANVQEILASPYISPGYRSWAHAILAQTALNRHQWTQAEAESGIAVSSCPPVPLRLLWIKSLVSRSMLGQGRATIEAAEHLESERNRLGYAGYAEVAVCLVSAEIFHATGQIERAHHALRETLKQIAIRAAAIHDAKWRDFYLNSVFDNIRAHQLATQWLPEHSAGSIDRMAANLTS